MGERDPLVGEGDGHGMITQTYMPARAAIARLVEEGVVRGLDELTLDRLRAECWDDEEEQMEDAGLLGILTSFYEDRARGLVDGFLWHTEPFHEETTDVVAELSSALKLPRPLFRQLAVTEKISTARRFRETIRVLSLERDDGVKKEIETRSLDDVVACFNAELKARGADQRLIPLETSGEWRMVVAIELRRARRLAAEGALPVANLRVLET